MLTTRPACRSVGAWPPPFAVPVMPASLSEPEVVLQRDGGQRLPPALISTCFPGLDGLVQFSLWAVADQHSRTSSTMSTSPRCSPVAAEQPLAFQSVVEIADQRASWRPVQVGLSPVFGLRRIPHPSRARRFVRLRRSTPVVDVLSISGANRANSAYQLGEPSAGPEMISGGAGLVDQEESSVTVPALHPSECAMLSRR